MSWVLATSLGLNALVLAGGGYLLWKLIRELNKERKRRKQAEKQRDREQESRQELEEAFADGQATTEAEAESEEISEEVVETPSKEPSSKPTKGDSGEQTGGVVRLSAHEAFPRIARNLPLSSSDLSRRRRSMEPTRNIDVVPVKRVSDLHRATSSAHALDETGFYGRFAAGGLQQIIFEEEDRDAVIILADVSGSMDDGNRSSWLHSLMCEVIKVAGAKEVDLVLIPFTETPEQPIHASSSDELEVLKGRLDTVLKPRGGTDIDAAIISGTRYALDKGITEPKLLLITDGDDSVSISEIKQALVSVKGELVTVGFEIGRHDLSEISSIVYDVR